LYAVQRVRSLRPPAVSGSFYPASRSELDALVDDLLAAARERAAGPAPKAIIAPHAGYVYSGPVAASAFARLALRPVIERVVLIGPAHRAYVDGLVGPDARAMRTPLGDVAVDTAALEGAAGVGASAEAHAREHSIEVELPFLQKIAPAARVVPLLVGRASPAQVGRVLDALWGGDETAVVVSSDLTHYLPYDEGRLRDRATSARVVALDDAPLSGDDACGAAGINGLLWVARERGLRAEEVDLRSSGDTAGPRDEVVGYGAFCFHERGPS
jgi:AmmeMemoRadiSam system protein B